MPALRRGRVDGVLAHPAGRVGGDAVAEVHRHHVHRADGHLVVPGVDQQVDPVLGEAGREHGQREGHVQYTEALRRFFSWDGRTPRPSAPPADAAAAAAAAGAGAGTAPSPARPTAGPEVTQVLVTMRMPAAPDAATTAILRDYLAFWDGYTRAFAAPNPVDPLLRAHADPNLLISVMHEIQTNLVAPGRSIAGPVRLSPAVRSRTPQNVVIDDCFDASHQQFLQGGTPTGETGTRSAQTVTLVARPTGWTAQSFAPGPVNACD